MSGTTQPASIQFLLRRKLDQIRSRHPAYSMRSFAKRLDVHPGALSEILNGRRTISTRLAARIAGSPALDEHEREELLILAGRSKLMKKLERRRMVEATELQLDQYFLVSEWYYYAILSLAETRGFRSDPKWIARRLGLPRAVASRAVARLVRLGYFKRQNRRLVLRPGLRLSTSQDIASASLKRRHQSNHQSAQEALENVPVELREFTFMTMAINMARLPEAKLLMREFRERLCTFLEEGEQTEVYELCLGLFPRSLPEKGGSA